MVLPHDFVARKPFKVKTINRMTSLPPVGVAIVEQSSNKLNLLYSDCV